MFSLNEWVVKGKVVNISEKPRGFIASVKGIAENENLFNSDIFEIDCWISKRVLGQRKIIKEISMKGKFRFKKNECYFVADEIL